MSQADLKNLGLEQGDEVEVTSGGRSIFGPVRLSNGVAPGVILLSLGYGRTRSGTIGDGLGFNAATLQTSASLQSDCRSRSSSARSSQSS
jgi:anaerobic selenocysteine-containing dehydrogenase